jgi:hypothetical protein
VNRATRWTLALAALLAPACDDGTGPGTRPPQTEFVTVRRAWLPGERDSLIARIQRTRQLSLPYAGDLSDYADQLIPADSAVEIVANPALAPSVGGPFSPTFSVTGVRVPGTGWTTAGLDVLMVDNTQSPPDTLSWLGWFWWNNADSTQKGYVFVATKANTVAATTVNTTSFDASFQKTGAGGGEVLGMPPGNTYWQANGWTRRNTVSVTNNFAFGGTSTVTSGPFQGGTQQTRLMFGVIDSVRLDRQSGTGTPTTKYASITLSWVGSLALTCVFPTPCTTNALRMALARRGGR